MHRPRRNKLKGDHLWNSCGSEAGKDERKPSESRVREPGRNAWETRQERTGKARKRKRRGNTEEATVRQKREERKGRNRRPSSRKRRRSGRKKAEGKRKVRKAKAGSKHLRNSCGSESGRGEKKHTETLSTGTGKECTGNQAGRERGRPKKRKRKRSTAEATVRRKQEDKGKEETEAE